MSEEVLLGLFILILMSPLVALMRDQLIALVERNVRVIYVGNVGNVTVDEICASKYQRVY